MSVVEAFALAVHLSVAVVVFAGRFSNKALTTLSKEPVDISGAAVMVHFGEGLGKGVGEGEGVGVGVVVATGVGVALGCSVTVGVSLATGVGVSIGVNVGEVEGPPKLMQPESAREAITTRKNANFILFHLG